MYLPVHNICHSRINGPGNRLVIWVQGCMFRCKGCFNPETHPYTKKHLVDVIDLVKMINEDMTIEGITISGGEPFCYTKQLEELFQNISSHLTIIVYSGFSIEEINQNLSVKKLLKMIDLAIVGRYDENLLHPYLGKKFIKSTNRIDLDCFKVNQKMEYIINRKEIIKTGIFMSTNRTE